jgi:hypothetical protein
MFSSRASLSFLALVLASCVNPDAGPVDRTSSSIIGGGPSVSVDYPTAGVLLMRADFGGGQVFATPLCTGTLIAADVVMTAGHCTLDFFGGGATEYFFSFSLDVSAFGMTTIDLPPDTYPVRELKAHPSFDYNTEPTPGLGDWHDVGIAFLAVEVPGVTPEIVADSIDGTAMVIGSVLNIAGYGQTDPQNQAFGVKNHAVSRINEIGGFEMQVGDFNGSPQKCHGDSGGPSYMTFNDGRLPAQRVVGITSRAYDKRDCAVGGIDMRADAYRSWFDQEMVAACSNGLRPAGQCANGGGLPLPGATGPVDAGIRDTGVAPDTGLVDTGISDSGQTDSGITDSGQVDSAVNNDAAISLPDSGLEVADAGTRPMLGGGDRDDGCDCNATESEGHSAAWLMAFFVLALARPRNTQRIQSIQKRS